MTDKYHSVLRLYSDLISVLRTFTEKDVKLVEEINQFEVLYKKRRSFDIYDIISGYKKLEDYIVDNVCKWDLEYNKEVDLVSLMIRISYAGGSKRINPYTKCLELMDLFEGSRKKNAVFYKHFKYFFKSGNGYVISSINGNDKTKPFTHDNFDDEIAEFVKDVRYKPLFDDFKKKMSESDYNINDKSHLYASIILFNKKPRLYIGKASNKTRNRWYKHFQNVIQFLVGRDKLPAQLTDLWTLYMGPGKQLILTLKTDVEKSKLDKEEIQLQKYYLEESKKFKIYGKLHVIK